MFDGLDESCVKFSNHGDCTTRVGSSYGVREGIGDHTMVESCRECTLNLDGLRKVYFMKCEFVIPPTYKIS